MTWYGNKAVNTLYGGPLKTNTLAALVVGVVLVGAGSHAVRAQELTVTRSVTLSWEGERGKFYRIVSALSARGPWGVVEENIPGEKQLRRVYPSTNNHGFFRVEVMAENPNLGGQPLINMSLEGADLSRGDHSGMMTTLVTWDNANLTDSSLQGGIHFFSFFREVTWGAASIGGGSLFVACNFSQSDMREVDFGDSVFINCSFEGCDMPPWSKLANTLIYNSIWVDGNSILDDADAGWHNFLPFPWMDDGSPQ